MNYLLYCIRRIDFKNWMRVSKNVAKRAHKPRALILLDMAQCGLRYQIGYNDYDWGDFYMLNHKQRKTMLSRGINNKIIAKYNNREFYKYFDDKGLFYKTYDEFLHRDWLDRRYADQEDLKKFIEKHSEFIVKPADGHGGADVEKLSASPEDANELYKKLLDKGQNLGEEIIVQHKEMGRLHPESVNTMRIFSFFDGEKGHIVQAVLKMGRHNAITDNFSGGGRYTFLDNDGVALYPATNSDGEIYEVHPQSGTDIVGFKVPFIKEAFKMVVKASAVTPGMKYIGWDVAVTEDGPVIVEGNNIPGVFEPRGRFLKGKPGCLVRYRKYMDI